jgi:hypothetical protein
MEIDCAIETVCECAHQASLNLNRPIKEHRC